MKVPPKKTKTTKKSTGAKVIKLARRRRGIESLVRFIYAHGGRLGAFRGYGAARRTTPQQ